MSKDNVDANTAKNVTKRKQINRFLLERIIQLSPLDAFGDKEKIRPCRY